MRIALHVRPWVAGAPAMLLAGCGPRAADFAVPTDDQAIAAYRAGVEMDARRYEGLPPVPPSDSIEPVTRKFEDTAAVLQTMSDDGTAESLRNSLRAVKAVQVSACGWEAFDRDAVAPSAQDRLTDAIPAGYRCQVTITMDVPVYGRLTGPAEGYFYRQAGKLLYAQTIAPKFRYGR